jgi:hypothetical protein
VHVCKESQHHRVYVHAMGKGELLLMPRRRLEHLFHVLPNAIPTDQASLWGIGALLSRRETSRAHVKWLCSTAKVFSDLAGRAERAK